MLRLLSIEIIKLKKNRQFLILTIILILSFFGLNYIVSEIFTKEAANILHISRWNAVAFINGFSFTIPAMIIIMHTCSEYTYRTGRQNIIDGLTRKQYVATKFVMVVALALFTTILVFLFAFIFGIFSNIEFNFEALKYIVYYFIQSLVYLVLAFTLALFLKRAILSLSIFIVYSLIIDNYLDSKFNKIIGGLLPLSSCDHLIPMPFSGGIEWLNYSSKPEYVYLIFTCIYLCLFCFACFYRYEKQDL
ncbi:MAG: ABC transporter permease [Prevotellaceae bacterium]|jgi:hypothetical protein|nr:ABC transporter permease [Prevotellaceae bacterium]